MKQDIAALIAATATIVPAFFINLASLPEEREVSSTEYFSRFILIWLILAGALFFIFVA